MQSRIMSEVLVGISFDGDHLVLNPFSFDWHLSDADAELVRQALHSEALQNYANAVNKEEFRKKILSIASVLNLSCEVEFDMWTRG